MSPREVGGILIALGLGAAPIFAAAPADPQPARPRMTVVNVSSHCDWSWGHTRLWHEERYAEVIRQVLGLMRDHPGYVWLLENENEELAPFLKKADREWPGLAEEFWGRVREGRIEIINAISNPRLTEVYPETMVRNLVLAKEYFWRKAPGARLDVYNAIDLMCGPSQMPQILKKAGYRYFMFSRPVGPQVVFWRKGLDGTRMLSGRCFYGYDKMGKYGEAVAGFLPSPIWRLAIGGDDQLPDPELPRQASTWDPREKFLGTNARYFEEVEKCGAQLTELEGPLDSLECYVEAGLHGERSLYMQNNRDEDLLLSLEKAEYMASATGARPSAGAVEDCWRDILACAGHAIQWAWASDYEERMAFARYRRAKIERALNEALGHIASNVRFRTDLGAPVMVFNFHGLPITGPVEIDIGGDVSGLALKDHDGSVVPMQVMSRGATGDTRVGFVARDVPACGYTTFYLAKGSVGSADGMKPAMDADSIENELYRIKAHPGGALQLTEKTSGVALGSETDGFGDIVYYDAPEPKNWEMNGPLGQAHVPGAVRLELIRGPVFSSARASGTIGAHSVVRQVRLWHGCRHLDYQLDIEAADGSGVFAIRFPANTESSVRAGIPFGAESRDRFEAEPFRGEFFVRGYPNGYAATRWTDIRSRQLGYTFICPQGAHTGFAFDRDKSSFDFMLLRVRPLTSGKWGQMHPSIKGAGRHSFRCAVVPHRDVADDASCQRDAMGFHVPPLAFSPDLGLGRARTGNAPVNRAAALDHHVSFAEIISGNVVLSSLRMISPLDAGAAPGVEIRAYEASGRDAAATVRLFHPVASAAETDFLGRDMDGPGKTEFSGRDIRLKLSPWKIVNLRLRLAEDAVGGRAHAGR